jgi:hypothetical protein
MYSTVEFASSRLKETVVLYAGDPVYVIGVEGVSSKIRLQCIYVGEKVGSSSFEAPLSDPAFNITHFSLGYTNVFDEAILITRMGTRKWKQGLHHENLHFLDTDGLEGFGSDPKGRLQWGKIHRSDCLKIPLKGVYPTTIEVAELGKNSLIGRKPLVSSIALSRNWAVSYAVAGLVLLYYRGKSIGYSEDGATYKILKKYTYLQSIMRKDNITFVFKETENGR